MESDANSATDKLNVSSSLKPDETTNGTTETNGKVDDPKTLQQEFSLVNISMSNVKVTEVSKGW